MFCITHEQEKCARCLRNKNAVWVIDEEKGTIGTTGQLKEQGLLKGESSEPGKA